MPLVYIIILNYKKWHDVKECLESVFRINYKYYKVIVIDNDSGNNSLQHLTDWVDNNSENTKAGSNYKFYKRNDLPVRPPESFFPEILFIQNEQNDGFAGGNNIALRLLMNLDGFIWLLNPDMVVREDSLSELVKFANDQSTKSIIGTVTRSYRKRDRVLFYGGGKINYRTATVNMINKITGIPSLDYISGGSMFIHTGHLNEVGLFADDYFLYWEDTDWCYRARKAGYKMSVCMDAVCYDKISTTIGKSFLADYYYTKNGLIFVSKYRSQNTSSAILFSSIRLAKRIITCNWSRARGVYKGIKAFLKSRRNENK